MDKFKGDSLNVHDAMYYNINQAFEGGKIASAGFKQIHEKR